MTIVEADERLLLADLGMCKDLAINSGLTVAGGTPGFRPPEMDGGPAFIDTRADLWSLSALVRWFCAGSTLPEQLDQVLQRSLHRDPEQRHPDVFTWLSDVEGALAPPTHSVPTPTNENAGDRAPGMKRRLWWAVTCLLALGLGFGLEFARGDGLPPEATATAAIEIEGPVTATVGEPTTFTLRHIGTESWVWGLPTGRYVTGDQSVTLIPSSPGASQVTVNAYDEDGVELLTEHEFTVDAP